jgi:hypothetical protein
MAVSSLLADTPRQFECSETLILRVCLQSYQHVPNVLDALARTLAHVHARASHVKKVRENDCAHCGRALWFPSSDSIREFVIVKQL